MCNSQLTVEFRKWTLDIKFWKINKFVLEAPQGNRTQVIELNAWVTESNLMALCPLNMQEVKLHDQKTAQTFKYIKYMKLPEITAACMLYIFFCISKILEILRRIIFPGISLDVTGGTQMSPGNSATFCWPF